MHKEQIEKIKAGNLEELDKIYLEVKPKFFKYAHNSFVGVTTEEIEDIYQDTIVDFYNNIKRGLLTEISSSLSAYIIQIGKMKYIKLSDKKKNNHSITVESLNDLVSTNEYDHKIDEIIKYVFSVASDNCKQILTLFYYEKKTMWTDFIVVFIGCTLFHFIIAVILKSVSFFSLPWFIFYVIASIGFIVYEGAQIKNREQEKLNMRKSVQKHEESLGNLLKYLEENDLLTEFEEGVWELYNEYSSHKDNEDNINSVIINVATRVFNSNLKK